MRPPVTLQTPSNDKPTLNAALRCARAFILAGVCAGAVAGAAAEGRVLPVRERATAPLLDESFTFKVIKLQGYSVDVRINGEKRRLKLGEAFSPPGADCLVTFEEISPETRIARFRTDCD